MGSTWVPRYGLSVGLKNYAAAYCTGLLCARRLLAKVGLADTYEGNTDVNGEVVSTDYDGRKYYVEEVDDDRRPFRALLDVVFLVLSRAQLMEGLMSRIVRRDSQVMTGIKRNMTRKCTRNVFLVDMLESLWSTLKKKITKNSRLNLRHMLKQRLNLTVSKNYTREYMRKSVRILLLPRRSLSHLIRASNVRRNLLLRNARLVSRLRRMRRLLS